MLNEIQNNQSYPLDWNDPKNAVSKEASDLKAPLTEKPVRLIDSKSFDLMQNLLNRISNNGMKEIQKEWSVIGKGGFGTAHKGRINGKKIVLKIPAQGVSEAEVAKEIDNLAAVQNLQKSKHFIKTLGTLTLNGKTLIVTEYYSKGDLKAFAKANDLSPRKNMKIARRALRAVRDLHQAGMVHHDIKADNFLIRNDKKTRVYLGDFGLSGSIANPQKIPKQTNTMISPPESFLEKEKDRKDAWNSTQYDDFAAGLFLITHFSGKKLSDLPWYSVRDFRKTNEKGEFVRNEESHHVLDPEKLKVHLTLKNNIHDYIDALGFEPPEFVRLLKGLTEPDPKKRLSLAKTGYALFSKMVDEGKEIYAKNTNEKKKDLENLSLNEDEDIGYYANPHSV